MTKENAFYKDTISFDLRKTFEAMAESVVLINSERQIQYVNKAAVALFGYPREELLGQTGRMLYADEQAYAEAGATYQESENRETTLKFSSLFQRKDQTLFTAEVVMARLTDQTGLFHGYLLIGHDISDRVALEQQLERTTAALEDAIETISEGFALYDADDRLVLCNSTYLSIYNKSAPAMQPGTPFRDILKFGLEKGQYELEDMTEEEWLDARLNRHKNTSGIPHEQRLADGRWLQISERRTKSGGIAGIRTDITDLKNTQFELQEAYASIAQLTNSLSSSIIEVDMQGTCTFINSEGAKWFASSPVDIIGSDTKNLYSEERLSKTGQFFLRARKGEHLSTELCDRFPDGLTRELYVEYIPKRNKSGQMSGVIIVSTDITDHKKVEQSLAALYQTTSSQELSLDEKVLQILQVGCKHFDLRYGFVSEVQNKQYAIRWASKAAERFKNGGILDLVETYCYHTIAADGPFAVTHVEHSDIADHACYRKFGLESYIGAPILVEGEVFGTIAFSDPAPRLRNFAKTDLQLIRQFADWIGHEIARRRDHRALLEAKTRLEHLASTDDLTKILNRRAFMEKADLEMERYLRHRQQFAVLLLDIDHFKHINDQYGHATGDDVLQHFASVISTELRTLDHFGRIGGEEFCIILNNSTEETALTTANRLRKAVQKKILSEKITTPITCSIGIAVITCDDEEFSSILRRADTALYQAKKAGRNRCKLAESEPKFRPRKATGT